MSQHPVRLMVRDDLERRRLTVALRLILAIPLTAALKAVCDNVEQLKPYGHLLGD